VITVRRTYAYLLAFAGLTMVVLGSANLLQVLVDVVFQSPLLGTGNYVRDTVSRYVAIVIVGLPVWLIHSWWIERWLASLDERASTLRRLYLYVVLAVTAVVAAYSLTEALRIALQTGLGGSSSEIWERSLVVALPAAVVWLFHLRIAGRDRVIAGERDASATLRRWYVYGLAFVGLAILLGGAQSLVEGLWTLITRPPSAANSAAALVGSPATSALVGLGLWFIHWAVLGARREDGAATLRSVYLFLALTLAVAGTLFGLSELFYYAVARLLGVESPGGVGGDLLQAAAGPASVATVYGLAWVYQRAALRRQAAVFAEEPRQAGVRRLYDYLVSLVALSVLAAGVAGLVWTVGDVVFNTVAATSGDGWRGQVSLFSTMAIVGLPVWLLHWRPAPTQPVEAGSLARRLYIYLSLIGASLALLGSAAAALYRVIALALGEDSSVDLLADLAHAAALALVAGAIAAYHWRVLRSDAVRAPVTAKAEPAPPSHAFVEITARNQAALEHALSALRATGVQVTVRPMPNA
jgi:Domain of unknown function (DUF5671)